MLERSLMLIFKRCRSRKDGRRMRRKVESSEANIVRIGTERRKKISKPTGEGDKWIIFLFWRGKSRSGSELHATRKRLLGSGLSKQLCPALTSSIERCCKGLNPPLSKKNEVKRTTQTRQGEYVLFILFQNK